MRPARPDRLILTMPPNVNPVQMSAGLSAQRLLRLQTWLSPAFPTGGFAYSHGIENAVAEGRIQHSADLAEWLGDLLTIGSLWCDAVLFAATHRAALSDDAGAMRDVAELALALPPSRERLLETSAQGVAFVAAIEAGWNELGAKIRNGLGAPVAYPVAVAAALAWDGSALEPTLPAFLNASASALVSAAVRLVPLGQADAVATLAGLQPLILREAERAAASSLDDLGSATVLSDIQSMRHENLYSRLFRS